MLVILATAAPGHLSKSTTESPDPLRVIGCGFGVGVLVWVGVFVFLGVLLGSQVRVGRRVLVAAGVAVAWGVLVEVAVTSISFTISMVLITSTTGGDPQPASKIIAIMLKMICFMFPSTSFDVWTITIFWCINLERLY